MQGNQEEVLANLKAINTYSPFKSEIEILKLFENIKITGKINEKFFFFNL